MLPQNFYEALRRSQPTQHQPQQGWVEVGLYNLNSMLEAWYDLNASTIEHSHYHYATEYPNLSLNVDQVTEETPMTQETYDRGTDADESEDMDTERAANAPRNSVDKSLKESILAFSQALYTKSKRDRDVLEQAVSRVGGRLTKLIRERDALARRIDRIEETYINVKNYEMAFIDRIEDIEVDKVTGSLICHTKQIDLEMNIPTIGQVRTVPVGKFMITIKPQNGIGGVTDTLDIYVQNMTTPYIIPRNGGRYEHPHVSSYRVCFGDVHAQVTSLSAQFQFIPVLDYVLSVLTSYNSNSAYCQLLTGWGRNMKLELRICDHCFNPLVEYRVSSAVVVKCTCARCATCNEITCICTREQRQAVSGLERAAALAGTTVARTPATPEEQLTRIPRNPLDISPATP